MSNGFKWTDEACEIVRSGCATKKSYDAIAREINAMFGTSLTRNAMIGKANRLGCSKPRRFGFHSPRKPRAKRALLPRRPYVPPKPKVHIPKGDPVLLIECTGCRFPFGEDPKTMLFCNAERVEGCSYCEEHVKIVFKGLSASEE